MIEVKHLGNASSWDQQLIRRIFLKYPDTFKLVKEFTQTKEGILIVAGRHAPHEVQLRIDRLDKVLLLIVSDEEYKPARDFIFKHNNMTVWATYSNDRWATILPDFKRSLGCYVYDIGHNELRKHDINIPSNLWFFSGQNSRHRKTCTNYLKTQTDGVLAVNDGFNNGKYDKPEYFKLMSDSKLIPCPSVLNQLILLGFLKRLRRGLFLFLKLKQGVIMQGLIIGSSFLNKKSSLFL